MADGGTNGANYGGRATDYFQNVKQFIANNYSSGVTWIFKKLNSTNIVVITPSDNKKPVLIDNDLYVTGTIINMGGSGGSSDATLKENIVSISQEQIDNFFTINPIHFEYKSDKTHKTHYGVLAQDVEKYFPELVENNNILKYKTVNYQEFIPLIMAKMNSIQKEINDLKKEKV